MSDGSRPKRSKGSISSWDQDEALRNEASKKKRRARVQQESSTVEKASKSVVASSSSHSNQSSKASGSRTKVPPPASAPPRKICKGAVVGHDPHVLAFVAKAFKATSRFLEECALGTQSFSESEYAQSPSYLVSSSVTIERALKEDGGSFVIRAFDCQTTYTHSPSPRCGACRSSYNSVKSMIHRSKPTQPGTLPNPLSTINSIARNEAFAESELRRLRDIVRQQKKHIDHLEEKFGKVPGNDTIMEGNGAIIDFEQPAEKLGKVPVMHIDRDKAKFGSKKPASLPCASNEVMAARLAESELIRLRDIVRLQKRYVVELETELGKVPRKDMEGDQAVVESALLPCTTNEVLAESERLRGVLQLQKRYIGELETERDVKKLGKVPGSTIKGDEAKVDI